jgi:molybdenum cofactor cytidylyltransferase
MRLSQGLRLGEREIVAFVGGGGKTTAMFRLASEIVQAGGRVITSTTTRIFAAQTQLAPVHLTLTDQGKLPPDLDAKLAVHPHVLLTGPILAEAGKASGVSPELIGDLCRRSFGAHVLLEADGSRMRPLKAPADHEPVIPTETTLVVPTAGADVLFQPLDATHTHRPEIIERVTFIRRGEPVTPAVLADVLSHRQGGRKGVPEGARTVPLINKVSGAVRLDGAREAACHLLGKPEIEAVLLGNVGEPEPVLEAWGRVAAVVLAAGGSTRMGQLKQLLPWGQSTLVGSVTDAALASQVDEVIVVLGCEARRVAGSLTGRPARMVENPAWAEGQSTSVRAGLKAVSPGCSGVLFLLADQPFVTPYLVNALVERHRASLAPIVAPRVAGRRANPVLFDRSTWFELAAVTGDAGGRGLFDRYRERIAWVDWDETVLPDVDTLEDYQALRQPTSR